MRHLSLVSTLLAVLTAAAPPLVAQQAAAPSAPEAASRLDSVTLAGMAWRNIGPANMGGRVADIVGIPSPSKTFYVAAAGGGIWKTTNAGTTFRPIFEHERVVSMGALAIAPSDTNIVWAGTGEQNSRNSIMPGGGIYKSTDGGMRWQLMGLEETQQIARIVVDPRNADVVYVAALGHAWGTNKERGLYKTTDGGKSWKLIKFVSDRAGFIDVAMDPKDPNTLYASSYERIRTPWSYTSGGPGSALWKTTDAGATWTKIEGGGFPATQLGRIGIAISISNPNIVYALVEADSVRGGKAPFQVPLSDSANAKASRANRLLSGLYRSDDAGKTWRWMNDKDVRPFYYSQVRVDPQDPDRVYWSSTPVNFSTDGGKTVRNATQGIHVDHHAMWIDPKDPQHFVVGDDGGVSQTWDRGGNFDFLDVLPIGQFYEVTYDMAVPYRVCGGLQDNGSWCGPSRKQNGGIANSDWFTVGGGDGFYTAQDPTNPNIIYAESQGGAIGRMDYSTGERSQVVKPEWRPQYTQIEDSILIARGDTTKPESKDVKKRVTALRAQQKMDSVALDMRYNWDTPYFISPHSPSTLYIGGNRVLKSTNRGDDVYPISPDLSTQDWAKINVSIKTTGGITNDATGAETYGTITTLAESPVRPGLLYAGTDDGNFWLTRNDGATWENLTGRFPGLPPKTYVVRVEPSHFDTTTFYVAFDNHRTNDFKPYLYVTTDFGKSFHSIVNNLPTGGPDFLHVIREDPVSRDLLFAGTDVGAYVSLDRGAHWQRFMTDLPTVPVHDLKIQPRDHELIAATHGRGIWIVDIAPLEQMAESAIASGPHLFQPTMAFEYGEAPGANVDNGQQHFEARSAPYGASIAYLLTSGQRSDTAKVVITNVQGDTLSTLTGPGTPGLHYVTWNFRGKAAPSPKLSPAGVRDSIIAARKMDHVFDSLATAGVASKTALDRLKKQLASGEGFGAFFRRNGGPSGQFNPRPAESPAPRAAGARGRRGGPGAPGAAPGAEPGDTTNARVRRQGGAGGAPGASEEIDRDALGDIFGALRSSGALTRGFGGRGRGAPIVETGDYLVTLTVNGKSQQRPLRVVRVSGGSDTAVITGENEELDP
ncbi:MAG TPA: hypothetical protein VN677_04130 [Gemmatimonadaceae bacterium]|nr:hypothetical protein [Gemmatimonadaceae bacterium]